LLQSSWKRFKCRNEYIPGFDFSQLGTSA
jgi:hypothetical protein